ncbi:hypothetical protein OYE22_10165 [Streptomyces sp. 71268]|uniref:hypothetical protein n=1 Tax=Streptomyces sp. 71268 TaxID=3002640 RepID=UPI0023FA2B9A|nr:hypothetical protein [Streptomyces sp. 71268]WEV30096.1 hypothetical protein OYE22_10165 [Streptomyces sp. 71268]
MTPPERAPDNPPSAEAAANPPPTANPQPAASPSPAAVTAPERGPRPAHHAGPAPLAGATERRPTAETTGEARAPGGRGAPPDAEPSASAPRHPAPLDPRPHPADPTDDGPTASAAPAPMVSAAMSVVATAVGRADAAPSDGGRSEGGGPAPVQSDDEEPAPARSAGAGAPGPGAPGERRRGRYVDPVRQLLHQHRELCERAVDPWEIAAGLEARGVGDRSASRYRHRDVFSLAEELYARTPRAGALADDTAPPPTARATRTSPLGALAASPYGPATPPAATAYPYPTSHADAYAPYAYGPFEHAPYGHVPVGNAPCGHAAPGGSPYGPPARPAAGAPPACPRASTPRANRPRAGGSGCDGAPGREAGCWEPASASASRRSRRVPWRWGLGPVWWCWLFGFLLGGNWLLTEALAGTLGAGWRTGQPPYLRPPGPDGWPVPHTWPDLHGWPDLHAWPELHAWWGSEGWRQVAPGAVGVAALIGAWPPAVWCARWFAARARHGLWASRELATFAAGARGAFVGALTLFGCALGALLATAWCALTWHGFGPRPGFGPGAALAAGALGLLLFVARLLAAHGFRRAARRGLALACGIEALAVATALAAEAPRCAGLARPVERLVAVGGPAAVTTLACATGALVLGAYALGALTRPWAHAIDTHPPAGARPRAYDTGPATRGGHPAAPDPGTHRTPVRDATSTRTATDGVRRRGAVPREIGAGSPAPCEGWARRSRGPAVSP